MRTKELIDFLKSEKGRILPEYDAFKRHEQMEEIIQRLMEFDELKRAIHDTVDTAIELYSFLFAVTGEYE